MEVDEANAVVDAVALAEEVIVLVVDDPIDVTVRFQLIDVSNQKFQKLTG